MSFLSDRRAVEYFLVEGDIDMVHHQKLSMVRNGLLRYVRGEKRFELTRHALEIMENSV